MPRRPRRRRNPGNTSPPRTIGCRRRIGCSSLILEFEALVEIETLAILRVSCRGGQSLWRWKGRASSPGTEIGLGTCPLGDTLTAHRPTRLGADMKFLRIQEA